MSVPYCQKFQGAHAAGVPIPPWSQTGWSFLGSFVGIATLGLIHTYVLDPQHLVLFVPAFGAMAVLLFSAVKLPPSQPYNTIVGNSIGGCVGVLVVLAMKICGLDGVLWLAGALSVSLTIVLQEITASQHPPGGATALIFASTIPVQKQQFVYILTPALLGAVILVILATIMNNLSPARQYPQWWSPIKFKQEAQNGMTAGVRTLRAELDALIVSIGTLTSQLANLHQENPQEPAELVKVEGDQRPTAAKSEDGMIMLYLKKFGGAGGEALPKPKLTETFFSFLGSFLGMSTLGLLHTYVVEPTLHLPIAVASFGAMSVLVFSLAKAPLSQPVNVVLGNSLGAAVSWVVVEVLGMLDLSNLLWLSGALSVSLTIVAQERCNVVHPPGGATAMLFAITPPLQQLGAKYIFAPAFLGAVIMVIVGVFTNNLSPKRTYPQRWSFNDEVPIKEKAVSLLEAVETSVVDVVGLRT